MDDAAFPDDFCGFLQANVVSFEAAELLLLLARNPGRRFDLAEALGHLRPGVSITDAEAERYVESFRAGGLVELGADRRFEYRPASPFQGQQLERLERAYRERPVTLIRMIYALRDKRIQSFADAFKFRKG